MKSFLLALQFLTIIPLKINQVDDKKMAGAMVYFPVVGLLLGFALIGINNLLYFLGFWQFSINIILIISLILLTGGIHLDGLADTADAIFSRKSKEEMLEIMRDSHIGVMGVLSLISVILLKIALLSSINLSLKITALLLICALSRWALVLAMFLFPYARRQGKAGVFMQGINFKIFSLATILTLVCVIAAGRFRGLLIFGIIALSTYIIGKFISHKIGGITGDTLGAMNELVEVIALLSVCILQRSNLWVI